MMFRFPGETQQIERLVDKFADRFLHCNPVLPRVRKSLVTPAASQVAGVTSDPSDPETDPDFFTHNQSAYHDARASGDRISTTSSASQDHPDAAENACSVQSLSDASAMVVHRLSLSVAKCASTASSCSSSSCTSSSSSFCNLSHHSSDSTVSDNGTITSLSTNTSASATTPAAAAAEAEAPGAGSHMTRDEVFILSFAIIMLNTDLHVPHNKTRMTCDQWIKNLRVSGRRIPSLLLLCCC